MSTLSSDVRSTLRGLRSHPGFSVTAILTLARGDTRSDVTAVPMVGWTAYGRLQIRACIRSL